MARACSTRLYDRHFTAKDKRVASSNRYGRVRFSRGLKVSLRPGMRWPPFPELADHKKSFDKVVCFKFNGPYFNIRLYIFL